MRLAYPIMFHAADEGGFWCEGLPPFDGVFSEGETMDEARVMASEALSAVLASMAERGVEVPRPATNDESGVEMIEAAPEVAVPILLRWARQEAHLTQVELASRLHVTQQSVRKWEQPGANPSIKTLAKVARALGLGLSVSIG